MLPISPEAYGMKIEPWMYLYVFMLCLAMLALFTGIAVDMGMRLNSAVPTWQAVISGLGALVWLTPYGLGLVWGLTSVLLALQPGAGLLAALFCLGSFVLLVLSLSTLRPRSHFQ